jgi:hypothetical protein
MILFLPGLLAVIGCAEEEPFEGRFDLPTAAAVLQPELGSPFTEPIAYVASGHSGLISMLALKQGRFLADDDQAAFLRGAPIAAGQSRYLDALAVWAPSPSEAYVFGADRTHGKLIRVPHVVGVTDLGVPIEYATTAGSPEFEDVDGSGDDATLDDVTVKAGYTSTEEWTITFDGEVWRVVGSRSGQMPGAALTGFPYVAVDRALGFTINGTATEGDRFTITTDNGLVEWDVGGRPLHLAIAPDQSRLAVVVHDTTLDRPLLRFVEPVNGADLGVVTLPDDARPGRITWSQDGARLFVSDGGRPAVWEVDVSAGDAVIEHALPFRTLDVASIDDPELGTRLLYVAHESGREVWIYDLVAGRVRDVNATAPGDQGMVFTSPVSGIEAMQVAYPFPDADDDGVQRWGRSVAVSLYEGRVLFMEEHTGCLVTDGVGPRTSTSSSNDGYDHETSFSTESFPPYLEQNSNNLNHVVVNACAGVAAAEQWSVTFDAGLQGWRVEGILAGEQSNIAWEDQRYTSDLGEVSFLIRAGSTPSQDGWQILFDVIDGALAATGDNDLNGDRDIVLDMPSDPVAFTYRVGPSGGGWDVVDERPFVLVLSQSKDIAARVEPPTGLIEVDWE